MNETHVLLRNASEAIRAGNRREARHSLIRAVQVDPENHQAWLWLAGVAASREASLAYLEKAASLRPDDPMVKRAQRWALAQSDATVQPSPAPSPPRRRVWLAAVSVLLISLLVLGAYTTWRDSPTPARAGTVIKNRQAPQEIAAVVEGAALAEEQVPSVASVPETDGDSSDFEPEADVEQAALPSPAPTERPAPTATAEPGLPAKDVRSVSATRATWTPTPPPTPTPTPTSVPTATPVPTETPAPATAGNIPIGAGEHWIDVNLSTQTLVAYVGNKPVYTTLVSSGLWQFPTVTGQFRIYLRYDSQNMSGFHLGYDYYLPNVPYVMYFFEDYALHGAYWHDNFGTPMSHGCVNLAIEDAQWLYNFAPVGTLVNVHY